MGEQLELFIGYPSSGDDPLGKSQHQNTEKVGTRASSAWGVNFNNGNVNTNNRLSAYRVRPVSAITSLSL